MGRIAVTLLSGGMDSATTLAIAKEQAYDCHALSFDYGQRHDAELAAAARIATSLGALRHVTVKLALDQFGGSALTDTAIAVPDAPTEGIPETYVPARNTILLAHALGYAEIAGANDIFIGVNAVDYSGYPDCRPAFIDAFQSLARIATRSGIEGAEIGIHAPLIHMSKAEIIRRGAGLGVDFALTVSCYRADREGRGCGKCDACRLRREGFEAAGIPDPTRYQ